MLVPATLRLTNMWTQKLLRMTAKHLRIRKSYRLSIAFIDHRTMRRLNRDYRDKDQVTDILSFNGSGEDDFLGELLLAWPYVKMQARKNKKTLKQELALLLIHGMLHLWGHDHETTKDAIKMLPFQQKIFNDFLKA